jgi:hypothetical protein
MTCLASMRFFTIFFNFHFNVLSYLHLSFGTDLIIRGLPIKNLYAVSISHMHAKCAAHYILFGLKSDSYELPILLFSPASGYVVCPDVPSPPTSQTSSIHVLSLL